MTKTLEQKIKQLENKLNKLKGIQFHEHKGELKKTYNVTLDAEKQREHAKKYYDKNKDKILKDMREKYDNDEAKAKRRAKYLANKEEILKKRKEYYQKKKA
jgi:preprotein translocase subunit SecD